LAILLLVGALVFTARSGVSFTAAPDAAAGFSHVIRDNVGADTRVTDVAMLGAHDAFSDQITTRSPSDALDASAFNTPAAKALAPGLLARFSRAQKSGPAELLRRGVRYFDARVTDYGGEWHTQHGLISGKLETYLTEIIDFLADNPGELVIFDIQHAYLGGRPYADLFDFIAGVKSNGLALTDFIAYDPYNTPLGGLTYGQAAGERSCAVLLAKAEVFENCYHYDYGTSMRSVWHNKIRTGEILSGVGGEYDALKSDPALDRDKFRVNQAQTTPSYGGFGDALASVFSWSLLDKAAKHNAALIAHADFSEWLKALPIFAVDFADSPTGDFNKQAIEKINAFNRGE
jgi:hypothetical protein